MLESIPIDVLEKLLTKNQIDTIILRYDIIKRINPKLTLDVQYREIAEEYTLKGIPISWKLVQSYYYKYIEFY